MQPAKKAKAKSTPTIGAAAASKDVAKGKQSTKVQQPSAAEKGKAKAIMPVSAYMRIYAPACHSFALQDSASSSSSSDDDVNDAANTSGDETPLSALIPHTRARKQNTKSLSNISSRLPSDTVSPLSCRRLAPHLYFRPSLLKISSFAPTLLIPTSVPPLRPLPSNMPRFSPAYASRPPPPPPPSAVHGRTTIPPLSSL